MKTLYQFTVISYSSSFSKVKRGSVTEFSSEIIHERIWKKAPLKSD